MYAIIAWLFLIETIGLILDVLWNTSDTMGWHTSTSIYHVGNNKGPLVIGTVIRSA